MKKLPFLVVLLCFTTIDLWARVVYVDSSNVAGFQNGTSWTTAYSSFQAGINNAIAGDSVWVAKGTYNPASSTSFSMKDSVKIYGGFTNTSTSFSQRNITANITILKGRNATFGSGGVIENPYNLTPVSMIDGFTITGGKAWNGGAISNMSASPTISNCIFSADTSFSGYGGAIYNDYSSPKIINCTFSNNKGLGQGAGYGGAIANSHSSPTITNCTFSDNTAENTVTNFSSYVYCYGGAIYNSYSSPTIDGCTFTNNKANGYSALTAYGNGAAIYNTSSSPIIKNSSFQNNIATGGGPINTPGGSWGGAICSFNTYDVFTKIIIENCNFSNNIATTNAHAMGAGGAIYVSTTGDTNIVIRNCNFTYNKANWGGGIVLASTFAKIENCTFNNNKAISYGGGISASGATVTLINCEFTQDTAKYGGALSIEGTYYLKPDGFSTTNCLFAKNIADSFGAAIYCSNSKPKLVNNTITKNTAAVNGSGIYNAQASYPRIINSIVYDNTSSGIANDGTSSPSAYYSLIQGYAANAANHIIAGTTDPLFEDTTNGNFRLQFTSPCFNKGNNDSLWAAITQDLAGNTRILNDTVDIGAYEYMLAVKLGADTSICTGDTLLLDAHNPGSTYLWSNGATTQTIKVTANGTYYVAVTNTVGTARDTIVVQLRTLPAINIGNDTSFCIGNSVTLTAPSGKTYLWSTGSVKSAISVSSSGAYSVKITDNYSCSNRDTINIIVNSLPVTNLGNDTAICIGSSLTLDAQNTSATYLWHNNSTTQTLAVSAAGTYSVLVTDTHGCKGRDTININTLSLPTVNLGNDTTVCSGTSLTLDAQNTGANYLWSTSATTQTINVNAAGNYSVSVTDVNGCSKSDTLDVSLYSLPTVALGNDTAICAGASIVFDAQNTGAIYMWNTSTATQTITVSTAGSYNVSVTDANGCVNNDTINLSINALPIVTLGSDTTICMGSSLVLNAGNTGSTYIWNTSATTQTITVSTAGSYNVSVTDINSCSKSDTIDVGTYSLPTVTLGNDTAICAGYSLTINAQNPGGTYLWNTSATTQTISVSTAGSYNVSVTDANGCVNSDTINLSINTLPVVNLGNDTAICDGNTLTLDAMNTGSIYTWNTGAITQTLDVSAAGTYGVTVTDANNCSSSDTIQISINPLPIVNLGNDTTLFPNIILTLNADNPGATYLWNTGATTQTINVDDNGTYIVNVTDVNTCSNRDTIIVNFIPVSINNTILKDPGVTVTPNPTRTYIIITVNDNKLIGSKAVLTDMSGKNIQVIDIYETQQKVSLQGLTAGTYILRLQNNHAFRVIKQD